MSDEYDTIRLAHFDQRVCILERHYTIGGLNSFYRMGGRDYDVGLHAMTNFARKGTKKGPLAKLLRQLRFRWEVIPESARLELGGAYLFKGKFANNAPNANDEGDPNYLYSQLLFTF